MALLTWAVMPGQILRATPRVPPGQLASAPAQDGRARPAHGQHTLTGGRGGLHVWGGWGSSGWGNTGSFLQRRTGRVCCRSAGRAPGPGGSGYPLSRSRLVEEGWWEAEVGGPAATPPQPYLEGVEGLGRGFPSPRA